MDVLTASRANRSFHFGLTYGSGVCVCAPQISNWAGNALVGIVYSPLCRLAPTNASVAERRRGTSLSPTIVEQTNWCGNIARGIKVGESTTTHHHTTTTFYIPLRGDFEKYFHFVILFARRRKKLVVKLGLDIPQMLESVVICIFYGILCKSFVFKTWKREEGKT